VKVVGVKKLELGEKMWKFEKGNEPLVTAAVHSGHSIRAELFENLAISDADRLRAEDLFTERLADICANKIIVNLSRFEIDVNRSRKENPFYLEPEDAWGLKVWKDKQKSETIIRSLQLYDLFYIELRKYCEYLISRFGKFVMFDIHSYNYRTKGPEEQPNDPKQNPEIIVGTSNMKTAKWESIITVVEKTFQNADYFGRNLDVRRNIRYPGGSVARWIHNNYPQSACVLSLEFKKIFMDEWSGELYIDRFNRLHEILRVSAKAVLKTL
jgi:N-formylglutamate amidohydrolase